MSTYCTCELDMGNISLTLFLIAALILHINHSFFFLLFSFHFFPFSFFFPSYFLLLLLPLLVVLPLFLLLYPLFILLFSSSSSPPLLSIYSNSSFHHLFLNLLLLLNLSRNRVFAIFIFLVLRRFGVDCFWKSTPNRRKIDENRKSQTRYCISHMNRQIDSLLA